MVYEIMKDNFSNLWVRQTLEGVYFILIDPNFKLMIIFSNLNFFCIIRFKIYLSNPSIESGRLTRNYLTE